MLNFKINTFFNLNIFLFQNLVGNFIINHIKLFNIFKFYINKNVNLISFFKINFYIINCVKFSFNNK